MKVSSEGWPENLSHNIPVCDFLLLTLKSKRSAKEALSSQLNTSGGGNLYMSCTSDKSLPTALWADGGESDLSWMFLARGGLRTAKSGAPSCS
jgi:hypothetical protein